MKTLALAALVLLFGRGVASADDDPLEHAQRPTLAFTLGIGTMLAVDRTTDGVSHEQPATGLGLLNDDQVGLKNEGTLTVGLSFMQPLMRYAALGIEAQFRDWASRQDFELGYPRYQALDFALLPRLQLPLGRRVLIIATLPFGVSASFIDADIEHETFREEAATGSGFNLGFFVGASVALHARFGVRGELGLSRHWLHHGWRYTATNSNPIERDREEVSYATTTLILRASFYVAL